MALKKKPVTGMKDILPAEMEIRDYVIGLIKETYRSFGFSSIETPCVEHIENLCSKQGGDNEKLIFKILKRGEKLRLAEAKEEADLVDGGLRYDLNFRCPDIMQIILMSFLHRLKHSRWEVYGVRIVRREVVTASLCSVILTFLASHPTLLRSS